MKIIILSVVSLFLLKPNDYLTHFFKIESEYSNNPKIRFRNFLDYRTYCLKRNKKYNILSHYNYKCNTNSQKIDQLVNISKKLDINLVLISTFNNGSNELKNNVDHIKKQGFSTGIYTLGSDSINFNSKELKPFNKGVLNKKTYYLSYIAIFDDKMNLIKTIDNLYKKDETEVKDEIDSFFESF